MILCGENRFLRFARSCIAATKREQTLLVAAMTDKDEQPLLDAPVNHAQAKKVQNRWYKRFGGPAIALGVAGFTPSIYHLLFR